MTENEQIRKDNLDYTLFSWSAQGNLNPIVADRAEGVYIWDREGNRIIDFSSQLMNVNIGHGNPKVMEAVVEQMKQFSYVYPGMASKARGDLGKKLAEITPGDLTKSFFTLGGAEAIENAIKMARMYTGRHKVVTHYRSYHGATYGAISAGGDPRKFAVDAQGMPNVIHVENPYAYRCPWGTSTPEECGRMAAENMERIILFENPASIAAILVEGESGTSGCIKYPVGYMKRVREIADKYGIVMIADEVMSGFGRTGKWFGIENHGVVPDIICMAKGLTSGYIPLGAMTVSKKLSDYFNDVPMALGLTYSGHAVACAAALATIKVYEDEKLIENAITVGKYLDQRLAELTKKHPSVGDTRNTGLFGVIELVKNRETKEPLTPWNAAAKDMEPTNRMAAKIRQLGLFTFVRWNWIFVAPPLCITNEQLDEGLEIISKTIEIADEYYK